VKNKLSIFFGNVTNSKNVQFQHQFP